MRTHWYFGWNIVFAAMLLTLLTVGMRLGVGPFFLPMAHDLGFSRSLLASIIAVGMLCYGISMPIAGYLVERMGTARVLLLGAAIVVASVSVTLLVRSPFAFMLAFGIGMSLGLGFTSPVALTPVIARWFTRQRGMALFFLATGSMAGMAILTPLMSLSIEQFGWRPTLLGFAIVFALVTVPAALFVIREDAPPNADLLPGQVSPQRDSEMREQENLTFLYAIRTRSFIKVVLGLFACGFSMNLLGTHGVPMLMDHGFGPVTSSFGVGTIGLVAILGTLVLGRLSDMVPRRNILAAIYFIRGLGFFALMIVGTDVELYIAAAVAGLVWAGSIAMSSAILADIYGVRLVGVLYGTAYVGHQIGGMLSSWLGGWGFEHFGTHWVAFGSAGVLLLIAAGISMRLPAMPSLMRAPEVAAAS